jgi:hypothetical protein
MTKPHLLVRRALMCAALAALTAPAAALAAPDRTATLSSSSAAYAWDGPEGTGSYDPTGTYDVANCSKDAASYCDGTLVQIVSGGPVTIDAAIGDYSNPLADFDLYIYKSNAAGTATQDDLISQSGVPSNAGLPNSFEESASVADVEPGYYLVNVVYYETLGAASYKGNVSVTGATPAAGGSTPPPSSGGGGGGGSTPPPSTTPPASGGSTLTTLPFKAASTIGSAKKAKKARSLSFSATADQDISGLVVQLLTGKPGAKQKVVGTFKAATFAKGTRKIKVKLSKSVAKKLKKGKYTLAARGSVNGQALQATQAVTVKK